MEQPIWTVFPVKYTTNSLKTVVVTMMMILAHSLCAVLVSQQKTVNNLLFVCNNQAMILFEDEIKNGLNCNSHVCFRFMYWKVLQF